MKNGKVPTKRQAILLSEHGMNPDNYLVVKDLPEQMEVVNRILVSKHKIFGIKLQTRIINKD